MLEQQNYRAESGGISCWHWANRRWSPSSTGMRDGAAFDDRPDRKSSGYEQVRTRERAVLNQIVIEQLLPVVK